MPAKKSAKKSASKSTSKKPATKKASKTASRKVAKKASRKPVAKKLSAKRPAVKQSAAKIPAPQPPPGPRVVHWEVQAADPVRQQSFFADLFGWTVDANNPMNYGTVAAGGKDAIGGGIGGTNDATPRVTVYVQVPDITAALAKAEALGARTVMPRMDIGMIVMGQFSDLEGNVIGLVEGR